MSEIINAKTLRRDLAKIVERVSRGVRFTVLYRSRPAFDIVPVDSSELNLVSPEGDSVFGASAVGSSKDGRASTDHDELLYGSGLR